MQEYIYCLKFNASADSHCRYECATQQLCERWQLSFEQVYYPYADIDGGLLELQFVSRFDFPIFEQQIMWTFDSFSGELGNVLGFYVGLDFLTIIEFFVEKAMLLFAFACS